MNLLTQPDHADYEGMVAQREASVGSSGREILLNEMAWVQRRLVLEAQLGIPPKYTANQLAGLLDRAETYIAEGKLAAILVGEGCQKETCYCHDEDIAVAETEFCSHCGCRWIENI